jgi:hypothetical protein
MMSGDDDPDVDEGVEDLMGSVRSDNFKSRDFVLAFSDAPPTRSSRLETRLKPASRSRRRTSRMTWERMVLRALAFLIRFDAKSSSWSIKVNDGRSDGACVFELAPSL